MNPDLITPIVTIASTIVGSASVFGALYWVHAKSDDRWAVMQKEWLDTHKELLKISRRVEKIEDRLSQEL